MRNPLNLDAGDVPAPVDPAELAAAREASKVGWRAFPYMAWRYGAHGKRFSDSDSGYLITLLHHQQETLDGQVNWLAGVLAARGMPSWTLEVHLRATSRVLARRLRGAVAWDKLARAADMLGDKRRLVLSDEAFARIGRMFAERVGSPGQRVVEGAGRLLAAAVADEVNGYGRAVESIEGWFADPRVFSIRWIVAVKEAIEMAWEVCEA